jgi:hypothetical protein
MHPPIRDRQGDRAGADGVIVPEARDQPLTIVEFQFQADDTIYLRTVVEMAGVQGAFPGRVMQV